MCKAAGTARLPPSPSRGRWCSASWARTTAARWSGESPVRTPPPAPAPARGAGGGGGEKKAPPRHGGGARATVLRRAGRGVGGVKKGALSWPGLAPPVANIDFLLDRRDAGDL